MTTTLQDLIGSTDATELLDVLGGLSDRELLLLMAAQAIDQAAALARIEAFHAELAPLLEMGKALAAGPPPGPMGAMFRAFLPGLPG